MKSHQLSKHPLYAVWCSMISRCYCISATPYKHYGGKGIRVCQEWKDSFLAFYYWAIGNGWKKGLSLERRENDKSYEPNNCLFIERNRQPANRSTNLVFEFNGKKQILADWIRELGLNGKTVRRRLEKGWPFEKAVTAPIDHTKRKINSITPETVK